MNDAQVTQVSTSALPAAPATPAAPTPAPAATKLTSVVPRQRPKPGVTKGAAITETSIAPIARPRGSIPSVATEEATSTPPAFPPPQPSPATSTASHSSQPGWSAVFPQSQSFGDSFPVAWPPPEPLIHPPATSTPAVPPPQPPQPPPPPLPPPTVSAAPRHSVPNRTTPDPCRVPRTSSSDYQIGQQAVLPTGLVVGGAGSAFRPVKGHRRLVSDSSAILRQARSCLDVSNRADALARPPGSSPRVLAATIDGSFARAAAGDFPVAPKSPTLSARSASLDVLSGGRSSLELSLDEPPPQPPRVAIQK